MANKRMFNIKIVDSDAFLDMPLSTQCLYFHLNMRADDDGFIGNPKKIMRMVGCSEDDLKLLIAKRFVLTFENGVIVIKHWKMHNCIQTDRYTPTVYMDEKNMLFIKQNKSYTLDEEKKYIPVSKTETKRNQNGNKMETNRIQSVYTDIDKDTDIDLDIDLDKENRDRVNYQQIADMYNATCEAFPRLTVLSERRKKAIKARLKKYSIDDIQRAFEMAQESDFLKGTNRRNWSATFDWIMCDSNMAKILDGNYANKDNRRTEGRNDTGGQAGRDESLTEMAIRAGIGDSFEGF
ncbi:hypothetical protein [Faecalimonas umbilicata]|uniref:hypothetical protein n=1 Tax=Faecalimonas umbilicata TaxID=1912855 RepID=UPI0022E699B6|nr:hypothetical protein [Faecalimonas umbilicata]